MPKDCSWLSLTLTSSRVFPACTMCLLFGGLQYVYYLCNMPTIFLNWVIQSCDHVCMLIYFIRDTINLRDIYTIKCSYCKTFCLERLSKWHDCFFKVICLVKCPVMVKSNTNHLNFQAVIAFKVIASWRMLRMAESKPVTLIILVLHHFHILF